jgi:ATP-binding cassette subfamily B protein
VVDDGPRGSRRIDPFELSLEAGRRRLSPRKLPQVVAAALRLTWQASHRGFLAAASLQILGALSISVVVLVGQLALDAILRVQRGLPDVRGLVSLVVLLAVVTAVGSAAVTLQTQQQRLLSEEVSAAVWRRVLNVTGRVELEFYESPHFYDQLQRVQSNSVLRPITVTMSVFGLIGGMAGTGGLLLVLLAIDPLLVPVLVLAGIPSVLLSRRVSRLEFRFAAAIAPAYRARDYLRTVLTGRDEAKEVRAFGAENALRTRHDDRALGVLSALRRHVRCRQSYALAGVATSSVALGLSLAMLVWLLSIGRISLADAGAAALGVRLLSSRFDQFFQSAAGLFESSVFLEDLDQFFSLATATDSPGTGRTPTLHRGICVNNISYTYPGSAHPALCEVSLDIGAGEVVAIVGENGSGKTTLAKLIAGLYAPESGSITWDDIEVSDFAPAERRRAVSIIFQDFVHYQLSALENIGLGDPDRAEDEIAARLAAQRAGAAGFLEKLPDGYSTVLSKEFAGGHELSVGQWQRVALARALRRDAPLVILDEPSSALDPRAEHALFADVRATLEGRSALLISHRYATVRMADRIYVMRQGRIVEAGSHESLMALGGLYAELFSLQARAYLSQVDR